jgi:WD40 repeat protein
MWNTVALVVALTAGGPADEPHGPPAPAVDRNGFSLPPGSVARLGDPTRRHRYPSEWASFSDDDRLLARPVDGFVTIFDLEAKRAVTPGYLKDHPAAVLRFLPDGRHLLFTPTSKRVEVRDPHTGEVSASFEVPTYSTTPDLALPSADGKRVLVRFRDGSGYSCATVADLSESPPLVRTLRGSSSSDQWALSADGKRLFQGWDRGLTAYDTADGERVATTLCKYRNTYLLMPYPDGGKVIAGWDRGVMTLELTADGFGEPTLFTGEAGDEFAITPDGKTVVRAGMGVYDAKGSFAVVAPAHDRTGARTPKYSRSAARCVDLFSDRPPVVWDPQTGKTVYRFDHLFAAGVGLGVAADGTVSVRHADRVVRVYAPDGQPLGERTGRVGVRGTSVLAVSPDGLLSVEYDGKDRKLHTFDTATGTGTAWPQEFASSPIAVKFDSTGRRVFVSGGNYAGVFEAATGRRVRAADPSAAAAFSDDGRTLATFGRKDLRVVELASGKERTTAEVPATDFDWQDDFRYSRRGWDADDEPSLPRANVQFSADGGRVAAFWFTGKVTVFDAADGSVRFRETRQWSTSRIAAFRPDGDWFATTTRTQRRIALRGISDPRADRNAVILGECKSGVVALAFTPDGKRLVSAHEDGTALVWDVEAAIKGPPAADPEPGEALWLALASTDAKQAGKAVAGLVAKPDVALPLLAEVVRPETVPPADRVKAVVTDLGDRDFKVREAAEKQLRAWGEMAAEALRAAEETANPEQGERIRRLLDALEAEETDPERLRLLRAVEVLERIGTPPARTVLDKLAGGPAVSVVTREAKEAVRRMKERGR